MWDSIIGIAINYGLMSALFVGLMVYVLKDGRKREKKYQDTIDDLADCLKVVDEIRKDVADIKGSVDKTKR